MHWLCPKCRAGFVERHDKCPADGTKLIENMAGRVLASRWGVERLLGVGGGGATVWSAVGVATRNPVALKLAPVTDRIEALRFERGARISGMLDHPHIARVIEHGRVDDKNLLVMELLEGETLRRRLQRQRVLGPTEAARIVDQILDALEHAHGLGVVHRDIKLSNLFVTPTPNDPQFVKILDWGIAKFVGAEPDDEDTQGGRDQLTITQAQQILGTPEYMAPEQIVGGAIDARTDIYAMGIVLYKLLVGQHPFEAQTRAAMYQAHLSEEPPSLPPTFAQALDALIKQALDKKPERRWASAAAMRRALRAVMQRTSSDLWPVSQSTLLNVAHIPTPPPLGPISTPAEGTITEHAKHANDPLPAQQRSRRRLWIGVAIAAVALLGLGLPLALGGGGGDKATAGEGGAARAGEQAPAAAGEVAREEPIRPEPARVAQAETAAKPLPASELAGAGEAHDQDEAGVTGGDAGAPSEVKATGAGGAPTAGRTEADKAARATRPAPPPAAPAAKPAAAAPAAPETRTADVAGDVKAAPVANSAPDPFAKLTRTPATPQPSSAPGAAPAVAEQIAKAEARPEATADKAKSDKPELAPKVEEPTAGANPAKADAAGKDAATVEEEDDVRKIISFGAYMSRPVRVAGVEPKYTREAMLAKVEGTMIVRCVIELDGSLTGCKILKPIAHMEQAVMEALATHRYTPVKYKGRERRVAYVFNFNFRMPR